MSKKLFSPMRKNFFAHFLLLKLLQYVLIRPKTIDFYQIWKKQVQLAVAHCAKPPLTFDSHLIFHKELLNFEQSYHTKDYQSDYSIFSFILECCSWPGQVQHSIETCSSCRPHNKKSLFQFIFHQNNNVIVSFFTTLINQLKICHGNSVL